MYLNIKLQAKSEKYWNLNYDFVKIVRFHNERFVIPLIVIQVKTEEKGCKSLQVSVLKTN